MSGQLSGTQGSQFGTIPFPRTQIAPLVNNLNGSLDSSRVVCIREAEIKKFNKSDAGNTAQFKTDGAPVLGTDYYILRLPCQEPGTNKVRVPAEQPAVTGQLTKLRRLLGRSASHLTSAVRMFL